jgi:pimeloyl-ACP methyl ester carboxylesterase
MPTARINGADLYYEVHGEGRPLVLSHPGFTSTESWARNVPALAERYRVVVWDRRGCGRSPDADGKDSSAVWLADLHGLLRHLGIERAYVGGSSYGGMLTLELTLAYPEMVAAAIFLSGVTQWFGTPTANAVPFPDRRGRLAEIRCPVLIMQGEHDARFPPSTGEEARAAIGGAQLVIVPGAGHGFHAEAPDLTNRTILDFLARVDATAAAHRPATGAQTAGRP